MINTPASCTCDRIHTQPHLAIGVSMEGGNEKTPPRGRMALGMNEKRQFGDVGLSVLVSPVFSGSHCEDAFRARDRSFYFCLESQINLLIMYKALLNQC